MRSISRSVFRSVLVGALMALALAAATHGRPAQLALVRMAPGNEDALEALQAPVQDDGLDEQVLMVPLQAPPMAVRDIEEEEEDLDGEQDGGAVVADLLSRLLAVRDANAEDSAEDSGPLSLFSSIGPLTPLPAAEGGALSDARQEDDVVVLRVGRGLKSVLDAGELEPRESRVLEDDAGAYEDDDDDDVVDEDLGLRREHLRSRRALRLVVRQAPGDAAVKDTAAKAGDDVVPDGVPEGRADATTAAPGSFLETIQGQLPGQLQGLGGAMEESKMIVGSFQAIIMPGSAATDMGQQIQGFISNMPQIPQMPGAAG